MQCTVQVAAVTVRHPGIRRLNVKGVEWPEGTLHTALGGMTALEVLRLGGTALSDSSLSVLATLRTLRRVDISNATLGRYGSVSAWKDLQFWASSCHIYIMLLPYAAKRPSHLTVYAQNAASFCHQVRSQHPRHHHQITHVENA